VRNNCNANLALIGEDELMPGLIVDHGLETKYVYRKFASRRLRKASFSLLYQGARFTIHVPLRKPLDLPFEGSAEEPSDVTEESVCFRHIDSQIAH
jgi:hypothetical protein